MSQTNDSETTTHSSTSTGSLYPAERPLRNVNINPSYASVIEEQDQQIKHLQQQLAEFNSVRYRTLSGNASRGKNVVRTTARYPLPLLAGRLSKQAMRTSTHCP